MRAFAIGGWCVTDGAFVAGFVRDGKYSNAVVVVRGSEFACSTRHGSLDRFSQWPWSVALALADLLDLSVAI